MGQLWTSCVGEKEAQEIDTSQIEQYKRALDLIQIASQRHDLQSIITDVCTFVRREFQTQDCILFILAPTTENNYMIAVGLDGKSYTLIPSVSGLSTLSLASKNSVIVGNFSAHPAYGEKVDLKQQFQSQKIACVPLNDSSGVFALLQFTTRAVNEKRVEILGQIGSILSELMSKTQHLDDLWREQKIQQAIVRITHAASTGEPVETLAQTLIDESRSIVVAQHARFYFFDKSRQELWAFSSENEEETSRIPLGQGLIGRAGQTGEIINLNSETRIQYDELVDSFEPSFTIQCALYVPIVCPDKQCLGVVVLVNKADNKGEFTTANEQDVQRFAAELALVLRQRAKETDFIGFLRIKPLHPPAHMSASLLDIVTANVAPVNPEIAENINDYLSRPVAPSSPVRYDRLLEDNENPFSVPSWDFNVFDASTSSLLLYIERMYIDFNLLELYSIERDILRKFILSVQETYLPNPYHNFLHGFLVMHVTYLILSSPDGPQIWESLDILAGLTAALCHDIDHPGHSNAFEVNSRSNLALQHNDDSVLERHHAYTTFRIMKGSNILESLSEPEYKHVRKMIIASILGTDMAYHFEHCQELYKRVLRSDEDVTPLPSQQRKCDVAEILRTKSSLDVLVTAREKTTAHNTDPFSNSMEDRLILLKTVVHAADISGQVLPKKLALKWGNLVAKEFAYQSMVEKSENLPETFKALDNPLIMVEGQLVFSRQIVLPLWELMPKVFPTTNICVERLEENISHYEHEADRLHDDSEDSDSDPNPGRAVAGFAAGMAAKFMSFRLDPTMPERIDGYREESPIDAELKDYIDQMVE